MANMEVFDYIAVLGSVQVLRPCWPPPAMSTGIRAAEQGLFSSAARVPTYQATIVEWSMRGCT